MLEILPDENPELDKAFSVLILSVSSGSLGVHTNATLIVLASDDPYGVFIFSEESRPITVEEATQNVTLSIVRLRGLLGKVRVSYATVDDTEKPPYFPPNLARATQGRDYVSASGFALFVANQSEATITISVLDDDEPERLESVFIELLSPVLVEKVQNCPIPNSPRLGVQVETVAHLTILANDDPFGTLQLSTPVVRVAENHVGPIINVTRTGGAFADVSVKFKAVPITAIAGEDYSVASSDVVLLEGETSKAVPIYIINDIYPELEESFLIQLLNETTGGAAVGALTEAIIIIEASDDPYGLFGFQINKLIVEEPEFNSVKVNLPIIQNSGTLGNVTVQWVATINGQLATGDLRVVSGNVTFAPGETIQTLLLEVLADDVPEIEEVIQVQLTDASGGGTVGLDRVASIIIPANDNPYGTVAFVQSVYRVQEPLERSSCANITVRRSGGHFGQLLLLYSTSDIDAVSLTVEEGQDVLSYYELPVRGLPDPLWEDWVNVSAVGEPQYTCATLCLRQQACLAFSFLSTAEGPQCFWMTLWISPTVNSSDFRTYRKNMTRVVSLFSGQAVAGSDYEPVTRQWAMMLEGDEFANLTVSVLPDDFPEMDESFLISLLEVHLMNITASFKNQPTIGQPNTSTVVIALNGDAFGVFVIYSIGRNTSEDGSFVEVQEQPQTLVELMIHRTGGSLGQVTVEWRVAGGTATEGLHFIGAGDILTFAEGETKKTAILTILDDAKPEGDESIIVSLVNTEGGSRILPSSDTVRVNILANDNVAGIVSFQMASRSVIGHEDAEGLAAQIIIDANDGAQGVIEWQCSSWTKLGHPLPEEEAAGSCPSESEGRSWEFRAQHLQQCWPHSHRSALSSGAESEHWAALVTVLANDDGPGVLSFNNSERLFLREPAAASVSLSAQQSEAVLSVVREPAQGLFGTVTVQFPVTEANSSAESQDLTPSRGYIVLEEGVRFKFCVCVCVCVCTEPEMAEHFVCTLFNPTGGARLGSRVETLITVLQNQAPLGLFSISAVDNRATSINTEEANRTVYLNVSRTNGIELAVNVQWETVSETAFGMRGMDVVLSIIQSFLNESAAGWCFFTLEDSLYGIMLRKSSFTLYRWQGIFIPLEDVNMENPKMCEAFHIGLSPYFVITHKERNGENLSANSVYTLTSGFKLFLVQTIIISESSQVKYFTSDNQDYLIVASQRDDSELTQVFRWTGGIFVPHQKLPVRGVLATAMFLRGGSVFLTLSQADAALVLRWSSGVFATSQELPVSGTTQLETLSLGNDVYLIFAKNISLGDQNSIEIFIWETGQPSFRYFQSVDFATVNRIHSFTPASGIAHILLAGPEASALYGWDSGRSQFSLLLEAPSAHAAASVTVRSLNSSKSLVLVAGVPHSHVLELASVSSQSDFVPGSGELIFEPGDREAIIAVTILDDAVPEEEESFRVQLKNPTGGAEIGTHGSVKITILSNDDAHGVVAFAQNSLYKQVEEMEQDSLVTLNVERLKGTYGHVTVVWEADGSVDDIFPTSGVISFAEGQTLSTITLTVLADDTPELSEVVTVTLAHITTEGVEDPSRGAAIHLQRNKSVITTLPSDSPHGLVGWHSGSLLSRVAEPAENITILQLQIVRDEGLFGDVAIHLIAKPNLLLHINNQATENEDYVLQETIIMMKENIKETHAKIAILPDDAPELEEGFVVAITEVNLVSSDFSAEPPRVRRPGLETAEVVIEENDDPRGVFKFHVTRDAGGTVAAHELPPPLNILLIPVARLAGSFGLVSVHWTATPGSAGSEDFLPSLGTLEFADGQVTAAIEVTIIDDAEYELMEMFSISLTSVSGGGTLGDDVVLTVVIPQNDSPFGVFGFEEQTVMVDESLVSDDPDSSVMLMVVRSPGGKGPVQLQWVVEDKAKDDLSPLKGILHFDETESQKSIILRALQGTARDWDRCFTIQLTAADEVEIAPGKGRASIIIRGEKAATGNVGIAPSSRHVLIGEPSATYNGTAVISLVRGPSISGEVTVWWRIFPPSLEKFAEASGKLTMQDGQSAAIVVIQALNDNIPEEKRFYEFQLTDISEGAGLSPSSHTANITMVASDAPYGHFAFSQEQLQVSEEVQRVNVTVVRAGGYFGLVRLWFETVGGTADAGVDFVPVAGQLLFQAGEMARGLQVEILDDDHPEGPEDFSLVIMKVELQGRGYDFAIQGNGLQIDQPPEIGNISTIQIIIMKNDNAEGIIEFDPKYTAFQVEEDVGVVAIPVVRLRGTYGHVAADFVARSPSAVPGGVDHILHSASVAFQHGQNLSFILVSVAGGEGSGSQGPLEVLLTRAAGGALLGRHLVSRVTVAPGGAPFGVVRFLNQSSISLLSPDSTTLLPLALERTGGLLGEVQVAWDIVGPNSEEALSPLNGRIADPVRGSFYFAEGEGGVRTLLLTICPHGEPEVEETFTVNLKLVKGEAKLDSRAKAVTLIIRKRGGPSGVVSFASESTSVKTYVEPLAAEGPLLITFFVKRVKGTFGEITVYWGLRSEFDITGDFLSTNGFFTIAEGESDASFDIHLLPDDTPEVEETYAVQLLSVEGGADLDLNSSIAWFSVLANDNPHGVFALYSEHQSVLVGQNLIRSIQVNVTRLAGTFGDVAVKFQILSEQKAQPVVTENVERQLVVEDGVTCKVAAVPMRSQVFLSLGSNFTVQLVTVMLVSGHSDSRPTILQEAKSAVFPVPENAANSQVGFESTAARLLDVVSGWSQVTVCRRGTYGALAVAWTTGYAPAPGWETPKAVLTGNMTPALVSLLGVSELQRAPGPPPVTCALCGSCVALLRTLGGSEPVPLAFLPRVLLVPRKTPSPAVRDSVNPAGGQARLSMRTEGFNVPRSQRAKKLHKTRKSVRRCERAVRKAALTALSPTQQAYQKSDESKRLVETHSHRNLDVMCSFLCMFAPGSLSFSHGEARKHVSLRTFPSPGQAEAFAIHLSGVQSSAPGGARLRPGFTVAEIEPMGIFQFSPSSRNITVSEDARLVRLQLQRLYGFHGDLVKVSYETVAGSAKPMEDFELIQSGEVFFHKFQTEVDFEIAIINDQIPEKEEIFYINLTSIDTGGLEKLDVNWRPRLNLHLGVAVITVLDDDHPAGMEVSVPMTAVAVAVGTPLIPPDTDSTTHPGTGRTTAIPQAAETLATVPEATGIPATPEKPVTHHRPSTMPEKPDEANVSDHGTFSLGPAVIYVEEEMKNGTLSTAEILIRRTGGFAGNVSVTVRTFGERCAQKEPNALPFPDTYGVTNLSWAAEGQDFEEQMLSLTFLHGEREHRVSVPIVDDEEPEGQKFFYVFLTDPQGGAQIVKGEDDAGFTAFAVVIITGSDLHNGILGFSEDSQSGMELGAGAEERRLRLVVTRQPNRAFEDVQIHWRVSLNKSAVILQKEGLDLRDELLSVSGTTTCMAGRVQCLISLELKPEETLLVEMHYFFVELYEVTAGAAINNSARFARIGVSQRRDAQSLIYFSVGSRLAVAHRKATLISLQVTRDSAVRPTVSVSFSTQELRSAETIGRTLVSPAVSGKDFERTEGTLLFEPGQRDTVLDVILMPETGSSRPFPKRFQVVLFDPKGGARIDGVYGTANVTLVSDAASQAIWGLADQLQQPLDEDILRRVLHSISVKVTTESTEEQLSAAMHVMEKITVEGRNEAFSVESRALFYEILCALVNPEREDTRGFSHLTDVTESFAFALLTDVPCGSAAEKSKTILDSCPYLSIMAFHWDLQQINGHKFVGKEGDYIQIPERLLDAPDAGTVPGESTCKLVQFTEYSSQQWFVTANNLPALKNKVLSLSVKGQSSQVLANNNEVLYRIYAAEPRIVPQSSLCLLWNQATESWWPDSPLCRVVGVTTGYVDCACSHMSVYAVYAQTHTLSAYNEAFFSSGFICISGLSLTVVSQVFCAGCSTCAAKLLMHMMAAGLGTQIVFLVSAYASPQLSEEGCSAIAAVTHYLYLCQFSWMLVQSVNFWYVLVMSDEHTERRCLLFLLLGWGLPALVVILLIVVLRGVHHQSMPQIYGLVHGDLCCIPNVYTALFVAGLAPLACLVVVLVVFVHAYQVKPQWKAYDDVFRGRTNGADHCGCLGTNSPGFLSVSVPNCSTTLKHKTVPIPDSIQWQPQITGSSAPPPALGTQALPSLSPPAGAGLSLSDTESGQGSQEGGALSDSQIVELRRIPIADTHL
ncbi:G-protein coupled receptor 98 [Heterocephalus glaber]|uniref:G-protein coupled receptor 98 n=1 Tax=Heterocephalus glaber TaxID=10181 RepID=G5BN37_HETGA|nr:G-protein coupled receptor 98 [Heterocephalus glaber]